MTTFATRPPATVPAGTDDPARRHDPRVLDEVCRSLAVPRPARKVEDIEAGLLAMWQDVLSGATDDLDELEACSAFFSRLGFLHKYKVYGVKIALPFGYSLFDLADGQGFSFQVHEEPKLEGFHVLRPRSDALMYVAGLDEWESTGRDWAVTRLDERPRQELPPGALVPLEGDVAAVRETGVVHTVLGCVLEEYASCSVDSVVRLHDQNDRSDPVLPARHPSTAALLRLGSTGVPRRHLVRCGDGWATTQPGRPGEILETGQVRGWRVVLRPGVPLRFGSGQHVTSVVVVTGRLTASVSRLRLDRRPGEVVVVPPGLAATLTSDVATTVAVHQVPAELATYRWSR